MMMRPCLVLPPPGGPQTVDFYSVEVGLVASALWVEVALNALVVMMTSGGSGAGLFGFGGVFLAEVISGTD